MVFACVESSHVELRPTIGRPPNVSFVYVQLKSVRSSHDVGSRYVPLAAAGMSSSVEHDAGIGPLDPDEPVPEGELDPESGLEVDADLDPEPRWIMFFSKSTATTTAALAPMARATPAQITIAKG